MEANPSLQQVLPALAAFPPPQLPIQVHRYPLPQLLVHVLVVRLTGETVAELDVEGVATIESIKTQIHILANIPIIEQRLVFRNQELRDEQPLAWLLPGCSPAVNERLPLLLNLIRQDSLITAVSDYNEEGHFRWHGDGYLSFRQGVQIQIWHAAPGDASNPYPLYGYGQLVQDGMDAPRGWFPVALTTWSPPPDALPPIVRDLLP